MNATKECQACIFQQIQNTLKLFPQENHEEILEQTKNLLCTQKKSPPPKIALPIYENLAKLTNTPDIYQSIKKACIQKAHQMLQELGTPSQEEPRSLLKESIKIAALGNVIDYGAQAKFSWEKMDLALSFARFDFEPFWEKISRASTLLYLADNAGENIFDTLLIKNLKTLYPDLNILYLTRHAPIINDLTLEDITQNPLCTDLLKYCTIASSHVCTPGFIYEDATKEIQEIFDRADLIIAKGMGNFECLESHKKDTLFFLFKIKCQVVANFLSLPIGKMIFKQNISSPYLEKSTKKLP
ncbi:damage-control phosphatase ARMT1 family protein [Helicobacter mustelae]|uniref:Damage-control phosphatase ARMT1-like metal-binding domain-containing protein n=1 Tax=Helicobacter mustelae (strain ATCC 43772 / CCUG 25715 / CIP 103759 / LMG 18044 / NCTC 12198 / R85-136P) TaxID=679897 RepID=D3UGJ6_HELM1|nr:ARMT1-like domain-containing protein [Helicobacter mustelae]CBG39617.1 Putative hypothetical protein [Helicobacter mustelae 12198]SQH71128.1 Protein of uncharacterised function DUF89 [Helicobacter mustelae]